MAKASRISPRIVKSPLVPRRIGSPPYLALPRTPKIAETIKIKMMAPKIEGTNAIPAKAGPQEPNSACPNQEPIKPARILAIQPIEPPRLVIAPATAPIIAPTINDHNHPNIAVTPLNLTC